MAKRKLNKVSAMRINEVSLVDIPANAGSTVVLMKRADAPGGANSDTPMEYDDMPQTLEELAKALADAQDANEALQKRAEDAEAQVAELKKAGDTTNDAKADDDAEDVMKSLPEPLRKQWQDMQASNKAMQDRLAKQQEEQETQAWIGKAAALDNLSAAPGEMGPLLRRVEKGLTTAEDAEALLKTLTAANAMAAAMTREAGKTVAKVGSAEDQLYQRAAERVEKSNGQMTKAQAVNAILAEDKALYSRYLAEQGQ